MDLGHEKLYVKIELQHAIKDIYFYQRWYIQTLL